MKTLIEPGAKSWEMSCRKCCARFRYELSDLSPSTFLWSRIGYETSCPSCGEVNSVPTSAKGSIFSPGRERSYSPEANPPSYENLVEELEWCVRTISNAVEVAPPDDPEELEEVTGPLADTKRLVERARSFLAPRH